MQFFIIFSIFFLVHGQLSVNELFYFNSKYTSIGNCSHFQYGFSNIEINSYKYNQLIFDCNTSTIIFRNQDRTFSSICRNDEDYLESFRLYFSHLSQRFIEVNQIHLHGIELCTIDDLIQNIYSEYSYYRSRWALLINLKNSNQQEQYHLALATNGEMTFILFLFEKYSNENHMEIIFPNENIFKFNQSLINVWRIDQGYIRIPKSLENSIHYQLSKTQFTLFNNETFFLYGTHLSNPRRFTVFIDDTQAICKYNHILECIFPILPLNIYDTHKPMLKVLYYKNEIFNSTLTLNSRIRLGYLPTNHSIFNIATYQVNIDPNLCMNELLQSLFSFIIHLVKIDNNGTERYTKFEKNNFGPIDCNTTAEIGQEIENILNPILIKDIILLNVDLSHQWYNHEDCRSERTRITFI